jgi:vacuolar protein sorting-associated protein 54
MDVVRQTQPTVQLLLSNNDYIGALSLISRTQVILRNELKGIQSFKYAPPNTLRWQRVCALLLTH